MYFKTIILISICCSLTRIDCELNAKPVLKHDLIAINNGLALDLLKTLPSDGNNFFSPLSITTALLMVMNGAKGRTQQEFRQFFKLKDKGIESDPNSNKAWWHLIFSNLASLQEINEQARAILKSYLHNSNDKVVMSMANLLLVQNGFPIREDYKKTIQDMFNSDIESVDFRNNSQQITEDINQWVSDQTNHKIRDLLSESLPEDTPMVLLNAIYFKGFWKYLFDRKNTRKDIFYNFGKFETKVDMMSMKRDIAVKHVRSLGAIVFEMPFAEGSDMSMVVILPDESVGLDAVTQGLSLKALNESIHRISLKRARSGPETIDFPKFKLESKYELKDYLSKLGLKSMFEDSADFSGVNGQHNLKVSKTIHKAFIEVNEEGAEAAAATAVIYALRSFRTSLARVDRPFLFVIVDKKTSLIWFVGQIRALS